MSIKFIALMIGFFSLIIGIINYDSAIPTSPVPVVSGLLVIVLAVFGLVPELKPCKACGRYITKKAETCHHCGAKQAS